MPKFKDPSPYIDEIETFQGNTVFEDVYITGDLYYDDSDRLHTNSVQNLIGPGAINLTDTVTFITTTGADAYTLADGIEGQLKILIMKVDGGDGTITPDNLVGWTSIRFNNVHDNVQLLYGSTGWNIIALQNATKIS